MSSNNLASAGWMEKIPAVRYFDWEEFVPCLDFECIYRNICWEAFAKLLKGFFPAEGLLTPGERQAGEFQPFSFGSASIVVCRTWSIENQQSYIRVSCLTESAQSSPKCLKLFLFQKKGRQKKTPSSMWNLSYTCTLFRSYISSGRGWSVYLRVASTPDRPHGGKSWWLVFMEAQLFQCGWWSFQD